MRVAALSTAFEPAKLAEGEESLVPRLHPKAHGVARHRFERSLFVHTGRKSKENAALPA